MQESEIERISANEREWRKHIIRDLNDIKKEQIKQALKINTLEIKMAVVAFVAGSIGSFIMKILTTKGA